MVMKIFSRTLAALALGLSGATALGQGTEAIVSIDVTPVADDPTRQAIALTISDAQAGSTLYIQGSADMTHWTALGQVIAGKTPVLWVLQQATAASPYFFRVKVDPPTDVMADGIYAKITTNLGVMTAKLEYEKVPLIVANFIGLAEGTKFYSKDQQSFPADPGGKPYFDGLIFHRVIKDFMIQGGCPLGTGTGNPGYWLPEQFHPDLKHDGPGVLSMANSGEHTNGSQFFITHAATPWLDFTDIRAGNHSVFGKVVFGMDVVDAIAAVAVSGPNKPKADIVIESVRILRVGGKAEAFEATEASIDQMLRDIAVGQMKEIQEALKIEPTDSGLIYEELKTGTGEFVKESDTVTFHYVAELVSEANEFGRVFADSVNPRPAPLKITVKELTITLPGAAEGVKLMKKGGHAMLYIPPELAYGKLGIFALRVPAHSVVLMEILLADVTPGG
jgi:cyclophilin family peptidyl-prolyl cis-trans isomerase/FKBP-type peptidyl-prolyl cis-trans isomerase